jgi:hypothetical protein
VDRSLDALEPALLDAPDSLKRGQLDRGSKAAARGCRRARVDAEGEAGASEGRGQEGTTEERARDGRIYAMVAQHQGGALAESQEQGEIQRFGVMV